MDVSPEYSLSEVALHSAREDLWIAINGKVYNVSGYLDDHPGGEEILRGVAGKEATGAFEDAAHSEDAYKTMEKLLIGKLPPHEQPAPATTYQPMNLISDAVPAVSGSSKSAAKAFLWCALGVGVVFAKSITPLPTRLFSANFAAKLPDKGSGMFNFWSGAMTTASLNILVLSALGLHLKAVSARHKEIDTYPAYIQPKTPISSPGQISKRKQILDPRSFQTFPLVEKQQIARGVYRFVLLLPDTTTPLGLPLGQHIRLTAEIGGKTIQRSYTPTSAPDARGALELTVKVYPQGKMGNYLLDLPLNSMVSVSGPFGRFRDYYPGKWEQVGCIAGGTGITPIYQIVRAICENPTDSTRISILYGNEMQDDILLKDEIGRLAEQHPEKLS
ncbi:hypothetical protein SLS56_002155 [Neofusicoccum ribis]|uniref:NADH-cytochrome b5 reductase 1 n=1 Tax=Neofusicoccum ribis TaxID=45134 RepID=A0ABR3T5F0_9PEZI